MAAETLTVNLTVTATPAAPRIPVTLPKDVSPCGLRKLVSEATKIPLDKLRLSFRGRLIGDDEDKNAVEEFKLEDGSVLHCMGKPEVSETPSAVAAAAGSPVASTVGARVTLHPTSHVATATGSNAGNSLQTAFTTLRANNPPQMYATAVTTLDKILNNIISNPMEEKYRKMRKQNPAFQKKLGGLTGGDAAMKGAGFVIDIESGQEVYVLHASAEKWPQLMAVKALTEAAVRDANAAANQASAPPIMAPGGMPNFGGMPGMGMPGGMSAGMEQFLSDPNALQAMLQVSVVIEPTWFFHLRFLSSVLTESFYLLFKESNGSKYDTE
jgi:PUB domain/Ubiquitin family